MYLRREAVTVHFTPPLFVANLVGVSLSCLCLCRSSWLLCHRLASRLELHSLVALKFAPDADSLGHFESFFDQTECDSQFVNDGQETKKPSKSLEFTGFSEERLMRFELTTTTLATLCSTN